MLFDAACALSARWASHSSLAWLSDLQPGPPYGSNPCSRFTVSPCINFNWSDMFFFFPLSLGRSFRYTAPWCQSAGFPAFIYQGARISHKDNGTLSLSLGNKRCPCWKKTTHQIQRRLCSGFSKPKTVTNAFDWCREKENASLSRHQHTTGEKQPPGHQSTLFLSPPTAPLNVRKHCSVECGGKGQPMVMPQLTLRLRAQRKEGGKSQAVSIGTTVAATRTFTCGSNLMSRFHQAVLYRLARVRFGTVFISLELVKDKLVLQR